MLKRMKRKKFFLMMAVLSLTPLLGFAQQHKLVVSGSPDAAIEVKSSFEGKVYTNTIIPSEQVVTFSVDQGTSATLTAKPVSGEFAGWTGDASGKNASVSVVINANKKVGIISTEP